MKTQQSTELIRCGEYLAEVDVELHEYEEPWSPTLPLDQVRKLERVRKALEAGNVADASRHARVFDVRRVQSA